MSEPVALCPDCNQPADGLDDEHCQLHWERLCSQGWWQMVDQLNQGESMATEITVTGIKYRETTPDGLACLEIQADLEPGGIVAEAIDRLKRLVQRELYRDRNNSPAHYQQACQMAVTDLRQAVHFGDGHGGGYPENPDQEYNFWEGWLEDTAENEKLLVAYPSKGKPRIILKQMSFDEKDECYRQDGQLELYPEQVAAILDLFKDSVYLKDLPA